jgi:TRAP-type mannitol/chloroaromatic compound transport system permease small subunit
MSLLLRCARGLDSIARTTGKWLAWFVLAMAVLQCLVVLLRYGFDGGSVALQDAVVYLHGAAFMLGLAYALHSGSHVRVDVFYRGMSQRGQAWVDAVGCLVFLLPLCAFILLGSWQFAAASWAVRESSGSAGGLAGVFLLKSLIPLAALTLALQGLAQLSRALLELMRVESATPANSLTAASQLAAEGVGA